jgi:protein SCO1
MLGATLALAPAAAANDAGDDGSTRRAVRLEQRLDARVPLDLELRDEHGAPATLGLLLAGRPAVLTLTRYGCPHLCPVVLEGLARTLREMPLVLGRDYVVITLGFDARETPAAAAETKARVARGYVPAARSGAWHFLTARDGVIDRVTRAAGFYRTGGPAIDEAAHPLGVVVLTPHGHVARYVSGMGDTSAELRDALVDAARGRIGARAEPAEVTCDGSAGLAHTADVVTVVRAAALLTLLGMGAFLSVMVRGARRRTSPPGEIVQTPAAAPARPRAA